MFPSENCYKIGDNVEFRDVILMTSSGRVTRVSERGSRVRHERAHSTTATTDAIKSPLFMAPISSEHCSEGSPGGPRVTSRPGILHSEWRPLPAAAT